MIVVSMSIHHIYQCSISVFYTYCSLEVKDTMGGLLTKRKGFVLFIHFVRISVPTWLLRLVLLMPLLSSLLIVCDQQCLHNPFCPPTKKIYHFATFLCKYYLMINVCTVRIQLQCCCQWFTRQKGLKLCTIGSLYLTSKKSPLYLTQMLCVFPCILCKQGLADIVDHNLRSLVMC